MSIDVNWSRLIPTRNKKYRFATTANFFGSVSCRHHASLDSFLRKVVLVSSVCLFLKLRHVGKIIIKGEGVNCLEVIQTSFERLVRSVRCELGKQRDKPIRINRIKISDLLGII